MALKANYDTVLNAISETAANLLKERNLRNHFLDGLAADRGHSQMPLQG